MTDDLPGERRSTLTRLMGDRPSAVLLRLVLVSLLVGFLMSVFGLDAGRLLAWLQQGLREVFEDSGHFVRQAGGYVLTGAAVVVPVWLLLRLLAAGRRRG